MSKSLYLERVSNAGMSWIFTREETEENPGVWLRSTESQPPYNIYIRDGRCA